MEGKGNPVPVVRAFGCYLSWKKTSTCWEELVKLNPKLLLLGLQKQDYQGKNSIQASGYSCAVHQTEQYF